MKEARKSSNCWGLGCRLRPQRTSISTRRAARLEDNDWLRTHPSRNATHESYDLVVTYKGGTLGDIPATNVLIKGWGLIKHRILEKEQKVGWEHLFLQTPHIIEWSIDSASNLETEPNEWTFESSALVGTHKVGTLGDDPATNVLIKG
jgi:hypothetical protein